jgi:hypothetical protein
MSSAEETYKKCLIAILLIVILVATNNIILKNQTPLLTNYLTGLFGAESDEARPTTILIVALSLVTMILLITYVKLRNIRPQTPYQQYRRWH